MGYKVIVPDLGGALTDRDKIIISRIKETPMKAQEAGDVVALTSGRPVAGMEPLVRELELSHFGSYILSHNGGMVTSCKTGETMSSSLPPRESNQKIIGLAEEHRVDILTCGGGEIITSNGERPYATAESDINHLLLRQVEGMRSYVDFRAPKFLVPDDGDHLVTVESKVKAVMGRDFSVYRPESYLLEIMPEEIDKTQSLTRLLEVLGLRRGQVIACGDGYDGLIMIKYAGLGMVIENVVLLVRQAVDYITASNSHDGVGVVIEKFMLP